MTKGPGSMSDLHMAAKHGDLFEEQDSQFDYGQKN